MNPEVPPHTSIVGGIAVQGDGKVLITTQEKLPEQPPGPVRLLRLHPDGRLDESFEVAAGSRARVHSIALSGDQKLLLGGALIEIEGDEPYSLVRLHPDESPEPEQSSNSAGLCFIRTNTTVGHGETIIPFSFQTDC